MVVYIVHNQLGMPLFSLGMSWYQSNDNLKCFKAITFYSGIKSLTLYFLVQTFCTECTTSTRYFTWRTLSKYLFCLIAVDYKIINNNKIKTNSYTLNSAWKLRIVKIDIDKNITTMIVWNAFWAFHLIFSNILDNKRGFNKHTTGK